MSFRLFAAHLIIILMVSIVIPCYNVALFIKECLQSIENQTFRDLEVVCVDDGSTDRTCAIIEELIPSFSLPIRLIKQENSGAPTARNKGLDHSNGEYIQFLDADDILRPEKIASQLALARALNSPDVIVGSYQRENMDGKVTLRRLYTSDSALSIWSQLMKTDLGITSANLFKSDLLREKVRWNESLKSSQEYELMFQLLKNNAQLAFDPEVNTIVRNRESGSISQQNIGQKWERYVQLRVDIYEYLKEREKADQNITQNLLVCLRYLYPFNSEYAVAVHQKHIPHSFIPVQSNDTDQKYIFLYRLIGFSYTEKLIQFLKKSSLFHRLKKR